ncbi:MAG: DnaD domain protein [Clostridia bacterium]|nr:DnaD domain protein [Clostridia bacterium]
MKYTINATVFGNAFSVPSAVADKHLKIATHTQLKVLLYFMRNISEGINPQKIAAALALPESEVCDALAFWAQCDVLISEQPKEKSPKTVILSNDKPTRADVIRRGLEDEHLTFLLREAQLKFGRNLKQNESSLIVSLYDDHGMDVSVILLLLQHASREGKCNITFIKRTATNWLSHGVETVLDAEQLIADESRASLAWQVVSSAFGIEKRKPSDRELELSNLWINEWAIDRDMLRAAYNECVDKKAKFSMAYTAKIIENWHKEGVNTPQQINAKKQTSSKKSTAKNNYGGYDVDLFDKMLDKDD